MLIDDVVKYTNAAFDMTTTKCVNLFIPNATDYNTDIIERELKNTQDNIYEFITSCEYAIEKDQIKALKKRVKKTKNEARKELYNLIGKEVIT